jgi:hypothetical protein
MLEDVVAPCVNDPLARTLLDGVVANLRMLTAALPGVAPFLRQDNQATGQLLAQLSRSVSAELAERVALALAVPEPDAADTAALDAHNHLLRELMAEAVPYDVKPDLSNIFKLVEDALEGVALLAPLGEHLLDGALALRSPSCIPRRFIRSPRGA